MRIGNKHISKKGLLKIVSIVILTLVLIYFLRLFLYMHWSFKVSAYCEQEAQKLVGDNWALLVPSNDAEKKQFPGLSQISIGFREQLKCEHNPEVLAKFPGWF